MRSKARRAAFAALVAMVLPVLTGCEIKTVTVQILGWDAYQVQGLWLWRFDEAQTAFQRDNGIQFHRDRPTTQWEPQFPSGAELVAYSFATGSSEMPARVMRDPSDPDRVTLQLWYLRFTEPGVFKASTYNAAGESPLSTSSILF